MSLGLSGERNKRKLVPTRWALTVVNKLLGDRLLHRVKNAPEVQQLQVYYVEYIGSRYILVVALGSWAFKAIEVWLSSSVWVNAAGSYLNVSSELWDGRIFYPEADGGYYAIGLPVSEY